MISPAFARLLAAARPELNRRMAEARRRHSGFDTAAFGAFLAAAADPVVCAAAAHAPERAGAVALAAFDAALALTAQGHARTQIMQPAAGAAQLRPADAAAANAAAPPAGTPANTGTGADLPASVWRALAPLYVAPLCAQPAAVLGMLTNAALHVQRQRGARVAQWQAIMAQLSPQLAPQWWHAQPNATPAQTGQGPQPGEIAQLSAVGQIAAWRAGMAHFRSGAIAVADSLPEPLAVAAFGAAAAEWSWPALRAALLADPWWAPDTAQRERLQAGIEIGSFTGLGGEFPEPPQVRAAPHGFWVRSGERHALLIADACGAVLHPASADEYDQAEDSFPAQVAVREGTLAINGREVALALPAERLAVVCNRYAAAVTSPYTHAIRVLPL
ncbi:hypothetical protein ASF61_16150 [Duganella sp. Leaf126]|uniref:hypothetical protein n=1 Tax=Duganella sp. Leaf126 TaxID=1736266 RepID=UPI0006F510CB|nr:hypothetical protein [Duganella sp. Leaf126]KQQ31881.1 hypothetical protein ASF61_16150 [Duganella sp. Leaf126]